MKTTSLIFLLLFCLQVSAQHNSNYSQYIFNGLLLNPAYAGSRDALDLTALYRRQWLGLDGAPTTITFSAHTPLRNRKANLGLVLANDKLGVSEHTQAGLVYAYRFKLNRGQFSLGLQAGVEAFRANWDQVRTTQLRDPSFTVNTEKKLLPQAGFGMYYYTENLYVGAAVPNMLNKEQPVYQTAMFHAGIVLKASEQVKIKPSVLLRYILNSPVDVNPVVTCYWKTILGIGVGYSINRTAVAFMDLKVNDQFRIGYAYDYTFSALRNYSTGSHELMLRYLFHYHVNASSTRYF
jgi:type IX secretion system PorP/SprF family membrane protein